MIGTWEGIPVTTKERTAMMVEVCQALVKCPRCDGVGHLTYNASPWWRDETCFLCHRYTLMFMFEFDLPKELRPYGKTTPERATLWEDDPKAAREKWSKDV